MLITSKFLLSTQLCDSLKRGKFFGTLKGNENFKALPGRCSQDQANLKIALAHLQKHLLNYIRHFAISLSNIGQIWTQVCISASGPKTAHTPDTAYTNVFSSLVLLLLLLIQYCYANIECIHSMLLKMVAKFLYFSIKVYKCTSQGQLKRA